MPFGSTMYASAGMSRQACSSNLSPIPTHKTPDNNRDVSITSSPRGTRFRRLSVRGVSLLGPHVVVVADRLSTRTVGLCRRTQNDKVDLTAGNNHDCISHAKQYAPRPRRIRCGSTHRCCDFLLLPARLR